VTDDTLNYGWEAELQRDAEADELAFCNQCPLTNRAGERCTKTHHTVEEPCSWA
jgi:hypothetical protein